MGLLNDRFRRNANSHISLQRPVLRLAALNMNGGGEFYCSSLRRDSQMRENCEAIFNGMQRLW